MGGDHGHGHGHGLPKVPDPSVYRTEAVPELMAVRRALAARGLKDPWLRNHVWKYNIGTKTDIFKRTIGRGMLYGFIAALITTGIGKAMSSGDDHHGHGPSH